jgi:hypothetical protein
MRMLFGRRGLDAVEEWRVHIGAHKTAPTHLQQVLETHRVEIAAAGIDYLPRDLVRELDLFGRMRREYRPRRFPRLRRKKLPATLAGLRSGPTCMAISEENFLGGPHDLLRGKVYPNLEPMLLALSRFVGRARLKLYLSIRDFADILPSAYSQVLRDGGAIEPFPEVRDRWLAEPPRWSDLVERIRMTVPHAELTVWTLDDYVRDERAVLRAFAAGTAAIRPVFPSRKTRACFPLPPSRRSKGSLPICRVGRGCGRLMQSRQRMRAVRAMRRSRLTRPSCCGMPIRRI